jgi:hypothetical protein
MVPITWHQYQIRSSCPSLTLAAAFCPTIQSAIRKLKVAYVNPHFSFLMKVNQGNQWQFNSALHKDRHICFPQDKYTLIAFLGICHTLKSVLKSLGLSRHDLRD